MVDLLEKSKYPIFVLEGPDGAGKTTLAMALKEMLGARYLHLTYRWKDKMHLYHYSAIRVAGHMAQHQPVIIDRWWPSEIVYADAYRGGSKFTKHYFLLELIASKIGLTYVMCLPEERDRYLEHYNILKGQREEMYNEGLDRVYSGYMEIYKNYLGLKENVCHYDMFRNFNDNSISRDIVLKNICQKILEFTEDHRSAL
jgi:transposase-like protein